MRRIATAVLLATPTLLAGCGSGPTAAEVTNQISNLYPAPHPRDNTGSCANAGCVQLITTDAVSVYQWQDTSTAQRFCNPTLGTCDQVGVFVLNYAGTEQKLTSTEARQAYAAKVRELTAG